MPNDGERNKVDELREKLYSRTQYQKPEDRRTPVESADAPQVGEKWDSPDLDEMLAHERRKPEGNPFMKKLFIFAAIFFVVAVAAASYMFLGGRSFVSTRNVDIRLLGPTSASAGDVLELGIVIANSNNADLEKTNLSIQYPQGSRDPEDPTKSLSFVREELGEVGAGREVTRTAKTILFGEQGEIQEVKVSVDYKVKGSNATFRKEKVFEVVIGETPISMTISQPRFVNSGDTFTTTITLTQNSSEILRNVMLRGEYPYGYTVKESRPETVDGSNLWVLGDLAPGSKKTLTIEGQIVGESEEERTFRFYVGVADLRLNEPKFGANLVSAFETVAIQRPSVALSLELNGSATAAYVAPAGQPVSGTIRFRNNLPDKLINPRLEARFSGASLDKNLVKAQGGGFYDSASNKITWSIESLDGAAELLPGAGGSASFSFASLPAGQASGEIKMEVYLAGTLLAASERPITVSLDRSVRISSQVTLASKALYSTGPFANRGSIPPKAEKETTYTIVLTAGNTQNDIEDSRVTASLGPNVEWLSGQEDVSYNEASNTVTWEVGALASGTGFSSALREASFQVSLTPSLSQVGSAPTLVSGISFSGRDTFTSQAVSVTNSPISTRLSSDPQFVQGDELVTR